MAKFIKEISVLALVLTVFTLNIQGQLFGPDVDLDTARFSLTFDDEPELGYRLPNTTDPVHYDLHLTTNIHLEDDSDPAKFQFDGEVKITFEALQATDKIFLHSRRLTIKSAVLKDSENADVQTWATGEEITYEDQYEFLVFELTEMLEAEKMYTIEVEFFGTLIRSDMQGFYRAAYTDETGVQRWLATTQFESTSAREAFPSFDEPGLRSTFKLSITHGKGYFAVANMPVVSRVPEGNDHITTNFHITPKMQTYLLAFAVSDFTFIENHSEIPQRVFARKDVIRNGEADFALQAGIRILNYLDEYVYQAYRQNNPKMDQIGIPDSYFAAGAMENWGLVTYREGALFYNEKTEKTQKMSSVAGIVAHEYAHQYFGNWVSPKWWSYLWLNEGFAQLYGNWLPAGPYPELNTAETYVPGNYHSAMNADALGYTRPMTYYVETPRDVSNLFDIVAYQKASAVLRMLSSIVTEDVWRKGLRNYLTAMENKAADSDDLARGIQEAVDEARIPVGATLKEIIDSWSLKAGLPLLSVELDTERNQLKLSQQRFLVSNDTVPSFKNDNDIWLIPLLIATATEPKPKSTTPQAWLKTKETQIMSSGALQWKDGDWVLVNFDSMGYYRVHYDANLFSKLAQKLNSDTFEEIPVFSRTQLLDDAFAFGKSEKLDYVSVFRLAQYLSREQQFLPWLTASNGFVYLRNLLAETPTYVHFNRFVGELVSPLYQLTGIHDRGNVETLGEKRAREVAIDWACRTGDTNCLQEARTRLDAVLINPSKQIEINLQGVLECAAIRQISDSDFDRVWTRMRVTEDFNERNRLITALGCTQNSGQQKLYLDTTLTTSGTTNPNYTPSERNRILTAIYTNERNGLINSIEFLLENYVQAKSLYPNNAIKNAITNMASYISSEKTFERYSELLDKGKTAGDFVDTEITRLKEIANLNLKWIEMNEKEIQAYFVTLYGGVSAPVISSVLMIFVSFILFIVN